MQNEVYKLLNKLNIEYIVKKHPPLFNCEDTKKYNIEFDAIICKNLFIRNSNKSQYYIFVLPLDKKLNLKSVQLLLEETRLSFGDEKILYEKLAVKTGSVSIFNVINLKKKDIIFVLDENILNYEKVAFHPNINTETVIFHSKEIYKIFEFYNIKYKFVTIQ